MQPSSMASRQGSEYAKGSGLVSAPDIRQTRVKSDSSSRVRNVLIDESGRIVDTSGESVVIPGLEPEKVLLAVAQSKNGEGQPLEEVRAELGA
jgi:hypothetical protein